METKLSLRKCVWKIDESRLSKISLDRRRVWYEGPKIFYNFLREKEKQDKEGEEKGRRII